MTESRHRAWRRATRVCRLLPALCAAAAATALSAPAPAADAATPPLGAFTYVGNVRDGDRSGVVDGRRFLSSATTNTKTALDSGDDMAAGDVLGDAFDEVVVADDGRGRIDLHDTSTGKPTSFGTAIGQDVNAYDSVDDDLTTGNVIGGGKDEIIVADKDFDIILVYSPTGKKLAQLGTTVGNPNFDGGDRVVAGDFFPGVGLDEIAVINDEDEGRIDVFDLQGNVLATRHSGHDGDSDDVAAGDVTGDLVDEVIVANDEQGRMESVDFATGKTHLHFTGYDDDDHMAAGDVTGDGMAEIVIANTEDNRVDVINFFGDGGTFKGAYDRDDRFAVGGFGAADLDGDHIPDRVELHGVHDAQGQLLFDLKQRGASPCRKDVLIEIDHMAGHLPDAGELANVVKTFADAKEVRPEADCPYTGVSTATGMNLIIDPALTSQISHQAKLEGGKAVDDLLDKHATLTAPFVRHVLWADNYVVKVKVGDQVEEQSPAGEAGHGKLDLDFIVALDGDGPANVASPQRGLHESTFMHELGHSLGLDHGGRPGDLVNCKPNYLSIMNYAFRDGIATVDGGYEIDFSHERLDDLNEKQLNEATGIGLGEATGVDGEPTLQTAWTNGLGQIDKAAADKRLDWDGVDSNGNGIDNDDNGSDGNGVSVNLNLRDPYSLTKNPPCEDPNDNQLPLQPLGGFDDWEHLNREIAGPNAVETAANEPTTEEMTLAFEQRDQLFFPDTAVHVRPPKAGFRGSVLGVALDPEHIYATHNYVAESTSAVDGKGVLAMLDRGTLAVQSLIEVGVDARAVAVNPLTRRAYVLNRGTGSGSSLSVINTTTRSVIKEIPLGQVGIDVAVNTRLNRVYVTNPAQESVQIVEGATNTLLAPVKVGKGLVGMTVDEATGIVSIAMTHRSSEPRFTALGRFRDSGATRTVLPQIDLGDPAHQAQDVAIDAERGRVFVGGLGGGTVPGNIAVLNAATGQLITRIPMRGPVRALDVNPQAGTVVAAGDRGVDIIDADALRVTRRIAAGLPFSVATEDGPATQLYAGDSQDGRLRRLSYMSGEAL